LIKKLALNLGWVETSPDEKLHHTRGLLRSEVLSEAVALDISEIRKAALAYFYSIKHSSQNANNKSAAFKNFALSPDVLNVVWDAGVIYGDDSDFEFVKSEYLKASFAVEKNRIMHALASARKPYQIRNVLEFALSGNVRTQDITSYVLFFEI
jgi:hypothetical protein